MSTELTPAVPAPEQPAAETLVTPRVSASDRARHSGYSRRFAALYLALALLAGVGVGALIVLLARPDAAPEPNWAAWKPSGSETAKTRQIADRVARSYRLQNGDQLAVALSGPPSVATGDTEGGNIPVRAIAVRPDTSTGQAEEGDVDIIEAGTSHQYVLCGLGVSCSIAGGVPSEERHALLRREALELALYTFKHVDSVDSVTVFLPPAPPTAEGAVPASAVFLRREDVEAELDKPLRQTLEPTTPGIGQMRASELSSVNRLTRPHLFTYEYTQAQDGSAILVLDPIVSST